MYKFSRKVAHVPNGAIGSPSPSLSPSPSPRSSPSLGLLDLLNSMNSELVYHEASRGSYECLINVYFVNISVRVILCYDVYYV